MEVAAAVVEAVVDIEIVTAVGGCLLAVAMMIMVEATDVPMAAVIVVGEVAAAAMTGTVAIAAQVDVEVAETIDVLAADAQVVEPLGLPRPSFAVFRVIPPILTSTTIVEQAINNVNNHKHDCLNLSVCVCFVFYGLPSPIPIVSLCNHCVNACIFTQTFFR